MPNHVINIVKFSARFDEIKEFVRGDSDSDGDQRIFDFNKIVPMPTEVRDSTEQRSTGLPDWYTWSVDNWGTKWNAYEVQESENGFIFWTAWSTPELMFIALSNLFPDVTITVYFADEDIGSNCGTLVLTGGECEYTEGDAEFATELWGWEDYENEEDEEVQ